MAKPFADTDSSFHKLLREQIGHEFTASQQYIAVAVYFDANRLPQLAKRFYGQAREERGRALMMVQYLLDRDLPVQVGGLGDVRSEFESVRGAVELALRREQAVTEQIAFLSQTARADSDYLGERFMQWFLAEQVEEVSSMTTLLAVIDRADGNLFDVEEFVARELGAPVQIDPSAPKAAGGGA